MISPNIIIIWPSTHASIPSGFTRETSLDGRFPKATADAVDPAVNGGSATHTHTSPVHTHSYQAHTHSGNTSRNGNGENDGGNNTNVARDQHIHSYTSGNPNEAGLNDAITYQAASSEPPYHEVIFIKASGYKQIPDGAIMLHADADIPDGFDFCDGDNGTPDLRNKYLKGAATAGNAGGTGGSLNHSHDVSHTHTARSHTHTGTTGFDSDWGSHLEYNTNSGGGAATPRHTHVITLNANSPETGSAYSGTAGSAETVEPDYKKLLALMNTSGIGKVPRKFMIAYWLGSLETIPVGWFLCDGNNETPDLRDKFIKIANDDTEIGDVGGSNTHTHAASNSHTHTAAGSHNHTGSTDHVGESGSTGASGDNVSKGHSHTTDGASSSATSVWNSTTIEADSSDNQPPFRTVAYIMFKFGRTGGGFPMLAL